VSVALAQQGKPYQYGAAGPGSFDCSGLVAFAYAAAGIHLAHYTGAQWAETTQIPLSSAQPGDLIFFNGLGHVGIYLGNGQMVDAPHTGAVVRVESIFGFGSIDGATRVT
jgi:cell wall-associated NlpC family hydrolase